MASANKVTFSGKFFCLPHSTDHSLEKYRYRRKEDELREADDRKKDLRSEKVNHEWTRKDSILDSLSDRHRKRLLDNKGRGSTPERYKVPLCLTFKAKHYTFKQLQS